jgi:hypothetical protein
MALTCMFAITATAVSENCYNLRTKLWQTGKNVGEFK